MNLITLAEARVAMAPYVNNGSCDTTTVDAWINEACARLVPQLEDDRKLRMVRIRLSNREFALPRGASQIRGVCVNGVASRVFDKVYQFTKAGPGDLEWREALGSGVRDLMTLDDAPYSFNLPRLASGVTLVAFGDSEADYGKELRIRGYGVTNKEIPTGFNCKINRWREDVEGAINGPISSLEHSTVLCREITQVIKPATVGYVHLYAVDLETNKMWLVGIYHPAEEKPWYRRYRVTNLRYEDEDGDGNEERVYTHIQALVKMEHVPLADADDILPIDSMSALKFMMFVQSAENSGDLNKAMAYESDAIRVLNNIALDREMTMTAIPTVIDHDTEALCSQRMWRGRTL